MRQGLWPEMTVLERGWLSANNIVFRGPGPAEAAVVDTGYVSHAEQTVALLEQVLAGRPLSFILNTHLHSDHCGGNAALQARWPQAQTWIAPGQAAAVAAWDPVALGYQPTGQACPRFVAHGLLQPGQEVWLGGRPWQIHAAPGHDPHAVVLFEPQARLLIAADALWEQGFGVVFPEIEGQEAFGAVAATLDVIERLAPHTLIPGHGSVFTDVAGALVRARQRLDGFVQAPERHARYAAKVLLKYKLLEWQRIRRSQLQAWMEATPYLGLLQRTHFADQAWRPWCEGLLADLERSGAARQVADAASPADPWVENL